MVRALKLLINERIKQSGLKKSYIADELGVMNNTVTRWCREESTIKLIDAIRLAKLLGIDLNDLWEE